MQGHRNDRIKGPRELPVHPQSEKAGQKRPCPQVGTVFEGVKKVPEGPLEGPQGKKPVPVQLRPAGCAEREGSRGGDPPAAGAEREGLQGHGLLAVPAEGVPRAGTGMSATAEAGRGEYKIQKAAAEGSGSWRRPFQQGGDGRDHRVTGGAGTARFPLPGRAGLEEADHLIFTPERREVKVRIGEDSRLPDPPGWQVSRKR